MNRFVILFFSFLLLNSVLSVPNCLADATWQSMGPFGGKVKAIAVDPADSQTLYAGSDGAGVFKSTNGGASWSAANSGITGTSILCLAIDPSDSRTLYVGTYEGGLFKTSNGGTSWSAAGSGITGSGGIYVYSLAIDSRNSQTVYVGTGTGIFKSINGGASWSASGSGIPGTGVYSLAIDPTNSLTLYAGSYGLGLFKSTNGGATWLPANSGLQGETVSSITVDPANTQTVYAGTWYYGISKSSNGGASWKNVATGFIYAVALDPANSQIVYAGANSGVMKSTNGGTSWSQINSGIADPYAYSLAVDPGNSRTVYVGTHGGGIHKSTNGGAAWRPASAGMTGSSVSSIIIDPINSQTVYAATFGAGIFKSTNGGASWSGAAAGITNSSITALAVDPANSQTLYAGASTGVFKSSNGGTSWTASNSGIPAQYPYVNSLAVDPTNGQTVYASTTVGIVKSVNGGASWSAANSGIPTLSTVSIVIDPTNSQTVYSCTNGSGIFKSTDGGASWTAANGGLNPYARALAIDPTNSQTLYAATVWGPFKSTNGGASWAAAYSGTSSPFTDLTTVVIDPNNSRTVYAGHYFNMNFKSYNGVYRSDDGGKTWTAAYVAGTYSDVVSIAIDPTISQTIYAGTSRGVFKTLLSITVPAITGATTASFSEGRSGNFRVQASGWPAPQFGLTGTLPAGLSFDAATGTLSGTPASGSAGSYPLMITATNGIPPDAARGIDLTVLPATSLSLAITAPASGAKPGSVAGIFGTASGSGLSQVEVQISDGTYHLQGNGTFALAPTWLPAAGTASWTLNTSTANWREGFAYTIQARASSGSTTSAPTSSAFTIPVPTGKTGTRLSLVLTPNSLRAGEGATISGKLVNADAAALSNQAVTLIITPPSTQSAPFPARIVASLATNGLGVFTSGVLSLFGAPGVYMVQARFEGTSTLAASSATQALGVTPQSGYAIIVSGKAADNSLLDLHTATTDTIRATLVDKRGFLPADINYLKSTASAAVTKQEIRDAVTTWARNKLVASPAPLYLIMIDHGTAAGFVLGDQTVTPDDLAGWMNTLESDPAVTASGVLESHKRTVIIGTCYSGAFISKLSRQGRVVITSSASDERSIAGFSIYNSASNTTFSGGEYFIDTMFNFLGRGDGFRDAFVESASMVALRDPRVVSPGFHSGSYDTLAQHPLLDDSGDAAGSYNLEGSADGGAAAALSLGVGIRSIGNPADITAVSQTDFIPADQGQNYPLWLRVKDSSRVAKAWVEIRTPNTSVSGGISSGQVIPSLVTVPLYYDGGQWQNSYTFSASGTYNILYYTQDNRTGDISPAAHSIIYKRLSGNVTPAAFTLISPDDSSGQSTMFPLSWQEVASANPLTYTLLVSNDQNFGTIVYKEEGIPQAATYIADGGLGNQSTGAYYCQSSNNTWCYWKVRAIDSYGAVTESDTRRFTTVSTNGLPALLIGRVRNNATGAPIAGAKVTAGSSSATTLANGAYLMAVTAGSKSLSAAANGYQSKTLGNLIATAGKVLTSNVSLRATSAGIFGDCNGDGSVGIEEVQGAIDMFIGLKTAAACVDTNGDKAVSIAEVQKVVNSFSEM